MKSPLFAALSVAMVMLWNSIAPMSAWAATASPQSFSVAESSVNTFAALSGSGTNFTLVTGPTNGTIKIYNPSYVYVPWVGAINTSYPNIQYTPTPLYVGGDSFVWKATDGSGTSGLATCTITVTPNHAPVANNQSPPYMVQNSSRVWISLSVTHADSGQSMSYSLALGPTNGILQYYNGVSGYQSVPVGTPLSANSWYYTPNMDYIGLDSFKWSVSDGITNSANATCSITVTPNTPPVANNQNPPPMVPNVSRTPVTLSYTDPDAGQSHTYTLLTGPANGTLQYYNGSYLAVPVGSAITYQTWYYTPTPGYSGTNTFTWLVNDGFVSSGIATCTLVVSTNNPPVVNKLLTAVSCQKNSTSNDLTWFMAYTHWDSGQTMTFKLVSAPTNGTLTSGGSTLNTGSTVANNSWTYTPTTGYTGPDGFVWNVNDSLVTSSNATVAITVMPFTTNAPPVFKTGVKLMDGTNALRVYRRTVNGKYDYAGYARSGYDEDIAAPEVVDWNNDGLMDLVVGEADGRIALFLNQGTKGHPLFNGYQYLKMQNNQEIRSWAGGCCCEGASPECPAPRVVDWNNDGKKDLIVGEWSAQLNLFVYINVGTDDNPVFDRKLACVFQSPSGYPTAMPFIADWNGDGINDLISGDNPFWGPTANYTGYPDITAPNGNINVFLATSNDHSPSSIYNNISNTELFNWDEYNPSDSFQSTAAPSVVLPNACPVGSRKSVVMADWTGTGRKDLVIGMQDGTVYYSINTGTSSFPAFTNYARLQAGGQPLVVGDPTKTNQDHYYGYGTGIGNSGNLPPINEARISVADLDGDGLMDLIVGDVNGFVTVFYQYNPKPVAIDQNVIVMPNASKAITLTARVDSSNAVAYTLLSSPTNGTLSGVAPNLTYTPHAGYTGPDSFTFNAVDGTNVSRTGTIYITVKNHPPVALWTSPATLTSTAIVNMNTSCAITLTATDESNEPLAYSVVTPPLHGSLSGTAPNLVYTPNANYAGLDGFTYKANDSFLDSNIATVTLDVCVRAVNFQPFATPVPAGYVKDNGALFDGGRGYGWSTNLTNSTTCWGFNPDPRMDTFVYSVSNAVWTCNLSNGAYYVSLGSGYYENRGAWADNHQDIVNVQGSNVINEAAANANLIYNFVGQILTIVTNGQLTVSIGGGTSRTRINFVEIRNAYQSLGAAAFVAQDATTQGSWRGTYGADGLTVCNGGVADIPPYAVVTAPPLANGVFYATTLSYPSTDIRALQCPYEDTRIASYWNRASGVGNNFTFDLNFTDGLTHRVAAYFLAWNNPSWSERIEVLDAGDNTVLDTRSLSNFVNGVYLVWNLQGHVKIRMTSLSGSAVMSGLFFGSQSAPDILWQPLDEEVEVGQYATFDVLADGAPLTYAWQRSNDGGCSWNNIPGANADTYMFATLTGDNGALFRCVVSSPSGTSISDPALLTTTALLPPPPVITSPLNVTTVLQQPFTYTITALNNPTSFDGVMPPDGYSGFTIDLEKGIITSSCAAVMSGSTTAWSRNRGVLLIPISAANAGGVDEEILVVTINDPAAPVVSGPLAATATVGTPFSCQIIVANTTPTTYSAVGLPPGLSVSNANGVIYGTPTSAFIGTTNITISAGNASGTGIERLVLTINAAPGEADITTQPANVTVTAGQTATFSVTATGTAPLTYKWRKAGAVIAGATNATYTTPVTTTNDNGKLFSVIVSNPVSYVISANAMLTVNPPAVAPVITTQPTNQNVTAGQPATFVVIATGSAPITYQWRKSGAVISGATNATYIISSTLTNDNGKSFSVIVSNVAGFVTSSNAALTVHSALVIQSLSQETSGHGMDFMTEAGVPYEVRWKTNLLDVSWLLYTNLIGSGGDAHVCFTNAVPQGFFQIRANP
jgi:hypothetical protein